MIGLVDFDDSFTFNIYSDLVEQGVKVLVIPWKEFENFQDFDGLIIGPGPGFVDEYQEFFPKVQNLVEKQIPLMGICLGHQLIWRALGCQMERLDSPLHGESLLVELDFQKKKVEFNAQFYNSWKINPPAGLSSHFQIHKNMCVSSKFQRIHTYQFHPESVGTNCRKLLFKGFLETCYNEGYEKTLSGRRNLRSQNHTIN